MLNHLVYALKWCQHIVTDALGHEIKQFVLRLQINVLMDLGYVLTLDHMTKFFIVNKLLNIYLNKLGP